MARVWQCDRCKKIGDGCVDDGPDGWVRYDMPVRGSEGARSTTEFHLCVECDDSLYYWLHDAPYLTGRATNRAEGG